MDSLSTWAAGDTDYVATHNADNAKIEAAVGNLETSKQDASQKGQPNGYASLGSDGTTGTGQLPTTVEYTTRKGSANGYAALDSGGHVPIGQLPIAVQEVAGGAGIDLTSYQLKSAKDVADGYAGLDGSGLLKVAELPATVEVTGHKGAASGYCDLDGSSHVPASRLVAANIPDLSSTYETTSHASSTYDTPSARDSAISSALAGYDPGSAGGAELAANKNQPSGYCGLDSSGYVAAAQLTAANIPDLSGTYKVLAYAEPVLLPAFYPGKPAASAVMLAFLPTVAVTISANLANTRCKAGTNPTAAATLSVQKNGSEVATIQIATNGAITLSTQAAISLTTSDELTIVAPGSQDATLADVRLTLAGTR